MVIIECCALYNLYKVWGIIIIFEHSLLGTISGLFSALDQQAALRVTTAAEIFFRYSKWHRLNQEVGKTTRKTNLDKYPSLSYFDKSDRSKSGRCLRV